MIVERESILTYYPDRKAKINGGVFTKGREVSPSDHGRKGRKDGEGRRKLYCSCVSVWLVSYKRGSPTSDYLFFLGGHPTIPTIKSVDRTVLALLTKKDTWGIPEP